MSPALIGRAGRGSDTVGVITTSCGSSLSASLSSFIGGELNKGFSVGRSDRTLAALTRGRIVVKAGQSTGDSPAQASLCLSC